jgi:APA family basic amino acid/polyamine antiporter
MPGHPWVPALGIVGCLVLVAYLGVLTWLGFLAWMGVGLMIYGLYGAPRSRLRARLEGRATPGPSVVEVEIAGGK